jgi:hypothetical protein
MSHWHFLEDDQTVQEDTESFQSSVKNAVHFDCTFACETDRVNGDFHGLSGWDHVFFNGSERWLFFCGERSQTQSNHMFTAINRVLSFDGHRR